MEIEPLSVSGPSHDGWSGQGAESVDNANEKRQNQHLRSTHGPDRPRSSIAPGEGVPASSIIWLESVAHWALAVSWFLKAKTVLKDRRVELRVTRVM
jgi:hypothetical protein